MKTELTVPPVLGRMRGLKSCVLEKETGWVKKGGVGVGWRVLREVRSGGKRGSGPELLVQSGVPLPHPQRPFLRPDQREPEVSSPGPLRKGSRGVYTPGSGLSKY